MLGIYRYMLEWLFLIRKIFQPPKIFLKLLVREFLNMGVPMVCAKQTEKLKPIISCLERR